MNRARESMAGAATDYDKFEGGEMGRLSSLPAAQNNNGNLFMPFTSSVYAAEVDKLKKAGKVAPSTDLYDPSGNQSFIHLFSWSGTVLKMLFTSPNFWIIMIINIVLSIVYYEADGRHESVDWFFPTPDETTGKRLDPPFGPWPFFQSGLFNSFGGLVTFMVVTHAIDCYGRFFEQYNTVRAIEVNINAAINIMRTHLFDEAFEGAMELRTTIAQLLVAQVYLGFGWLPTHRENGVDEWTWERVITYGLISPKDRDNLMLLPVGEYPIFEITASCHMLLQKHYLRGNVSEGVRIDLYEEIKSIQNNFLTIYAAAEQPVPFSMYHYISVINNMWLFMVGYQWIFYAYYYGIIVVFLHVIAFLGIRILANNLAEPFGADETDIPVFDFVVKWHTRVDNFINLPCKFGERLIAGHTVSANGAAGHNY